MITLQINHILQFSNHNIDLCLIWSSSAPTPTLMPLDCALSLPLLRAYHSTHLKHKCFRPSFMNLYNGQFDNSAHRGFRDKRCQLLMHSMNMPPSVGFLLSAILQCLEEQFGYGMSSTFNYTRWLLIRTVVLETEAASLYQDTRVPTFFYINT